MKVVLEHPFRALKFKVVFGKNSDRPEGEVQDVVEVRAKTLSVFFQTVSTEIFRKKKIFLSQSGFKVKALDHTPGTRLKVSRFLKLEMFNPTADQFYPQCTYIEVDQVGYFCENWTLAVTLSFVHFWRSGRRIQSSFPLFRAKSVTYPSTHGQRADSPFYMLRLVKNHSNIIARTIII